LWPGEGSIDWSYAMQALSAAPQVPAMVLEIEGVEGQDVAAKMAETYRKLEEAAVAAS
jgi:sugar phosphate isomerase/epimerase